MRARGEGPNWGRVSEKLIEWAPPVVRVSRTVGPELLEGRKGERGPVYPAARGRGDERGADIARGGPEEGGDAAQRFRVHDDVLREEVDEGPGAARARQMHTSQCDSEGRDNDELRARVV